MPGASLTTACKLRYQEVSPICAHSLQIAFYCLPLKCEPTKEPTFEKKKFHMKQTSNQNEMLT